MATYGDGPGEYPYKPTKRKKQKYSMVTRVIDFTNNLPIISGTIQSGKQTEAWAASDVLEAIRIKAGQTVLGVQVEILTRSTDSGDIIDVGYVSSTIDNSSWRWGRYNLSYGAPGDDPTMINYPSNVNEGLINPLTAAYGPPVLPEQFVEPLYFASTDTIDITIRKAAVQGRIRLIVHLLEDDR
jgi:hypothetical protein